MSNSAVKEQEPVSKEMEVISPHALELIQRAEIDMQIATARKFSRPQPSVIRQKMLSYATMDEDTAESCFYALRRRDTDGEMKTITGPSARLAEIALICYGNSRAASRVIDNDGRKITCQGVCHDLENNTLISVEVQRRITTKHGKTYTDDMQIVTANAGNSIAFRNAVLKVVPGALWKPVFDAAMQAAIGNAGTLKVKREKFLNRLVQMGATRERVLHTLGKKTVEDIDLADLETLVGIGTAIKEGDTTVDEAFPPINQDTIKGTAPSVGDLKPSSDANRGHDGSAPDPTKPITAEDVERAEAEHRAKQAAAAAQSTPQAQQQQAGDQNGTGGQQAATAGEQGGEKEPEPPADLPNLDVWPDNLDQEWYLVKGVLFRWNEATGNYNKWHKQPAVVQMPAPEAKRSARRPPRNAAALDFDGGKQ